MNKLEIISGSLKISKDGIPILLIPKSSCALEVNSLYSETPIVVIYSKYLTINTEVFVQPLSVCVDSSNNPFTQQSIITFAKENLGY
jgi:hypothetical protein